MVTNFCLFQVNKVPVRLLCVSQERMCAVGVGVLYFRIKGLGIADYFDLRSESLIVFSIF